MVRLVVLGGPVASGILMCCNRVYLHITIKCSSLRITVSLLLQGSYSTLCKPLWQYKKPTKKRVRVLGWGSWWFCMN